MNQVEKKYKAAGECLKFIYHLRMCGYYAVDFCKSYPNSILTPIFKLAIPKINWIYTQFTTHHVISTNKPEIIEEIKRKWNEDCIEELAVSEKLTLLNEEQMTTLNDLLDALITGEDIKVVVK